MISLFMFFSMLILYTFIDPSMLIDPSMDIFLDENVEDYEDYSVEDSDEHDIL